MLKVGDLIYFKDYFCEITQIDDSNDGDSRFDMLWITRKFRSDGTKINSMWRGWVYRTWVKRADEYFEEKVKQSIQLLETYKNLTNGSM